MPLKPSDKKVIHPAPKKQTTLMKTEKVRKVEIVEIPPVVKQEAIVEEKIAEVLTPVVEGSKSILFKDLVKNINQQQLEPIKLNFIK